MLLNHSDKFRKTIQNPCLSAAEGQTVANMTKSTLDTLRAKDKFKLFWEKVRRMAPDVNVNDSQLPRKRKTPARYENRNAPTEYHSTPEGYYRQIYYGALDLIILASESRFDRPGYKMYLCLQDLVIKAVNKNFSEQLQLVASVYGSDIDAPTLQTQL